MFNQTVLQWGQSLTLCLCSAVQSRLGLQSDISVMPDSLGWLYSKGQHGKKPDLQKHSKNWFPLWSFVLDLGNFFYA